jgi:translation initiation factor 4E
MTTLPSPLPTPTSEMHKLDNKWTLWAHLPQDSDWSLNSYKNIVTIGTVEQAIILSDGMPSNLVDNCMLFVMKDGIKPIWEDPANRNGGCFSYKISNKFVHTTWRNLFYVLVGGTISQKSDVTAKVAGITISPKKNFCVIKIWMSSCEHQDPGVINPECNLPTEGCLFKQHVPEY